MRKDLPRNEQRTALLIRCTVEEAKKIRNAARQDRRTVSAYVLNAVMNRINIRTKFNQQFGKKFGKPSKQSRPDDFEDNA